MYYLTPVPLCPISPGGKSGCVQEASRGFISFCFYFHLSWFFPPLWMMNSRRRQNWHVDMSGIFSVFLYFIAGTLCRLHNYRVWPASQAFFYSGL